MTNEDRSVRSGLVARDRRALLSVATQFFVNGAVFASFVPRLPEIRDRVDITTATLGALLAIAGVVGLVGSATVGWAISAFGSRAVMISAALGVTGSLAIVGVADTLPLLLIGLVGLATLDVLVDAAMNLQGSWISARRSTPVMNRLHGLWSLGTVLGALVAAQVASAGISLRNHLSAVAVLMFAVVMFVGRGLLRTDEHAPDEHRRNQLAGAPCDESRGRNPMPRIRMNVPLVLLAVSGACSIAMEQTSSDWAAFRLSDDFAAAPGWRTWRSPQG